MTRIMMLALLALLAACDKTPPAPMAVGATSGYAPLYAARDQGYLSGVNLKMSELGSANEVMQALRNHSLHMAALTLDESLRLRRDIPDLKIILLLYASREGGCAGDGKAVNGGAGDSGCRPLLPPKLDGSCEPRHIGALVTRDSDIGQYHAEIYQLVQGWQRALDYLNAAPAKPSNVPTADMQGTGWLNLNRNRELLAGDAPAIAACLESAQRALLEQGALQIGGDAPALIESAFLTEKGKRANGEK